MSVSTSYCYPHAAVLFRTVSFGLYLMHIVLFAYQDAASAETEDEEKLHPIRASLIKRIDSLNADVSSVTLCLFDTLLGTRREKVC